MTSSVAGQDLRTLLMATMQPDAATRREAEAAVESLKVQPGFAAALCFLVLDASASFIETRKRLGSV